MTDISEALLTLGYFPRELPSTFTTVDFGQHSSAILSEWRASKLFDTEPSYLKRPGKKRFPLAGSYQYKIQDTEAEYISKPKKAFERRAIHLTHPVPQALLATELGDNWSEVAKWLSRQRYSIDRVNVSKRFDRSIEGINFKVHGAKKSFIEATSDWLVKTDITRFYPSIYTHSIAWAAYGKERVKSDIKQYAGAVADRLDALVRACNRNQTVGIPIGPETSRIIAEIISARIDDDFHAANSSQVRSKIDRLQDDWFVGTASLQEAERVLSSISAIYRAYGLEINGSKTSIDRMAIAVPSSWPSELATFLAHGKRELTGVRLREFLLLGLRLQAENPTESVIGYVLSTIEGLRITSEDAEPIESFLLKGAVLSPLALDKICRVAINVDRQTGKLSRQRIAERFSELAQVSLERGHQYEAIWLLHTIRGLKQPLKSKAVVELIGKSAGAVLPIILLDMKHNGLVPATLPTARWEAMISEDRIRTDWSWLLAYEGIRHGWLSDPKGVAAGAFFKPMYDRNVVFYDPKKNVVSSTRASKARWARVRRESVEVLRFLQFVRGFRPSWRTDYDQ